MDLSTLLTNIDEHRYVTVGEFVSDADLIWQNALEYNPDSDPMGEHEGPEQFKAYPSDLNTRNGHVGQVLATVVMEKPFKALFRKAKYYL